MTVPAGSAVAVGEFEAVRGYFATVRHERFERQVVCRVYGYRALDVADLVLEGAVGPGWLPIVRDLHGVLVGCDPDYRLFVVKASAGRLHVEAQFAPAVADVGFTTVATAVEQAAETCELCGRDGSLRVGRPKRRTLCDDCFGIDRDVAAGKGERYAGLRMARLLSGDPRFPSPEAIIASFPDSPARCGGRRAQLRTEDESGAEIEGTDRRT